MASRKTRGSMFAEAVSAALELEKHETELLTQISRTLDLLDELDREIATCGTLLQHDGKVRPVVVEHRLQSVTLSRLLASLRLPDEFDAAHLDRGQRRGGARGTYIPRTVLEELRDAKKA